MTRQTRHWLTYMSSLILAVKLIDWGLEYIFYFSTLWPLLILSEDDSYCLLITVCGCGWCLCPCVSDGYFTNHPIESICWYTSQKFKGNGATVPASACGLSFLLNCVCRCVLLCVCVCVCFFVCIVHLDILKDMCLYVILYGSTCMFIQLCFVCVSTCACLCVPVSEKTSHG